MFMHLGASMAFHKEFQTSMLLYKSTGTLRILQLMANCDHKNNTYYFGLPH